MRLISVHIPGNFLDLAVGDTQFQRLGQVVVLAGANGSGKTRLLTCIRTLLTADRDQTLAQAERSLRKSLDSRSRWKLELEKLPAGADEGPVKQRVIAAERTIAQHHASTEAYKSLKVENWVESAVIPFTVRPGGLGDHRANTAEMNANNAREVRNTVGAQQIYGRACSYVLDVQNAWLNATHPQVSSLMNPATIALATKSYEELEATVHSLLGARLGRDISGNPTIFGQPMPSASLSPGQEVLLQLAIALHSQSTRLSEAVLILDEPENHLHPAAVLFVIQRLKEAVVRGQIWIATHSIPVLAAVDVDSIWYVDDGKASWAGSEPERVLRGLLGDDEGRARLEAFVSLPAQLATLRFAAECLQAPKSVSTGTEDVQLKQIRSRVISRAGAGRAVRVLDYGAGKARLLLSLRAAFDSTEAFTDSVDYIAFEPNASDASICRTVIGDTLSDDSVERRVYTDLVSLDSSLDAGSVDTIVMCNVLHEIDPAEWLNLFSPSSTLVRLLSPTGGVLVVEDQHLPTGENAHANGFLLLDNPHLKRLFCWREADPPIVTAAERGGRLRAHWIPAAIVGRVTGESRRDALKLLARTAAQEVARLRNAGPSFRNGQLHGLWCLLFANASFALERLGAE